MSAQEYYVAEFTKRGWRRISPNYKNVKEAQARLIDLKRSYPNTCVVAEVNPHLSPDTRALT